MSDDTYPWEIVTEPKVADLLPGRRVTLSEAAGIAQQAADAQRKGDGDAVD